MKLKGCSFSLSRVHRHRDPVCKVLGVWPAHRVRLVWVIIIHIVCHFFIDQSVAVVVRPVSLEQLSGVFLIHRGACKILYVDLVSRLFVVKLDVLVYRRMSVVGRREGTVS